MIGHFGWNLLVELQFTDAGCEDGGIVKGRVWHLQDRHHEHDVVEGEKTFAILWRGSVVVDSGRRTTGANGQLVGDVESWRMMNQYFDTLDNAQELHVARCRIINECAWRQEMVAAMLFLTHKHDLPPSVGQVVENPVAIHLAFIVCIAIKCAVRKWNFNHVVVAVKVQRENEGVGELLKCCVLDGSTYTFTDARAGWEVEWQGRLLEGRSWRVAKWKLLCSYCKLQLFDRLQKE